MLPERRKNLIIFIIGIIIFILLVISIFGISKYIKNRNEENNRDIDDRVSDPYPNDYAFYGITVDLENIYRIYGITSNYTEKYIGIRSFYKIQDSIIKDNHLFVYSDGVNDLRYDASNKDFYMYRYDDFYSNNINVKLTKDYMLLFDQDNTIAKKAYNSSETKEIIRNINISDILIKDNMIYYTDNKSVYSYDLNRDYQQKLAIDIDPEAESHEFQLLDFNETYLVYKYNGNLFFYHFGLSSVKTMESFSIRSENVDFISASDNGFYYQVLNEDETYSVKFYNYGSNIIEEVYLSRFKVNKIVPLSNDIYFMEIVVNDVKESILFSSKEMDIVKRLENRYINIVSLGSNNEN